MILKRIFLLLTSVLIGVLVSCQNEEMFSNPDATPLDGLSVVLTSDLIHTKAIGGALDTYATPEELRINKAHIVFFRIGEDGRPNEVIGVKEAVFQPEQSKAAATKEKLIYRIDNIAVQARKEKVYVLAIANSKYDFSACKRYADYLAVVEKNQDVHSQPTALFSPTDLVKRGGITFDLGTQDLSEAIEIPLMQLAAKVILNVAVDLPVLKETEGRATYSIDPYLSQINKENMQAMQKASKPFTIRDAAGKKMGIAYICKKEHGEKGPFWYNGKECQESVIVHVGEMTVDSTYTTVRPVLSISSFKINNVETKSDLLIPSVHTESSLLTLNGWKTNINVADRFTISFYTYQKELFNADNDPDVLTIELVDAKIINKTEIVKRTYTDASAHAVWTYIPNGGTDETKRVPITEWINPDKTYQFVYLEENMEHATLQPVGDPMYTTVPNAGSVPLKSNFIRINPKRAVDSSGNQICTDGLLSGNLYEVTATVRDAEVEADLDFQISSLDKVEVTIPFD